MPELRNFRPFGTYAVPHALALFQYDLSIWLNWAPDNTGVWQPLSSYAFPGLTNGSGLTLDFDAAGILDAYSVCVARSDKDAGFAVVPLDGIAQYALVDPPAEVGKGPAAPGKALVGRWLHDPVSKTGWAFSQWREENYDALPDGYAYGQQGVSQYLDLVMARSLPDGSIVQISVGQAPQRIEPPPPLPSPAPQGPELQAPPPLIVPGLGVRVELPPPLTLQPTQAPAPAPASQTAEQFEKCCHEIRAALAAIAKEIAALQVRAEQPPLAPSATPSPPTPAAAPPLPPSLMERSAEHVALSSVQIVERLSELRQALDTLERCVCDGFSAPAPVLDDPRARLHAVLDHLVAQGAFDPDVKRILSSSVPPLSFILTR